MGQARRKAELKARGRVQAEKGLLDIGDMLPEMQKANQACAGAAAGLVDAARSLFGVHADNGAVRSSVRDYAGMAAQMCGA
jgi:hypothetical protein